MVAFGVERDMESQTFKDIANVLFLNMCGRYTGLLFLNKVIIWE